MGAAGFRVSIVIAQTAPACAWPIAFAAIGRRSLSSPTASHFTMDPPKAALWGAPALERISG